MQSMNGDDQQADASLPENLDPQVVKCLGKAKRLAVYTRLPLTEEAHFALAMLSDEQSFLAPLVKELFNGLLASTVAESLMDVLRRAAPDASQENQSAEPLLAPAAVALLQRAAELSAEWQSEHVTLTAVAVALFEKPGPFVIEAFAEAGIPAFKLEALVKRIAQTASRAETSNALPALFEDGRLNFTVFGPVAQGALAMLARIGAAEPERRLRDADLLYCLVNQSDSLFVEALYVKGLRVPSIRQQLQLIAGNPALGKSGAEIQEAQMSRLLAGICKKAHELAAREQCALVSESHLMRAHLERVAGVSANIYEKLGIETFSLKNYLARYTADRPKVDTRKQAGMIEDIEGFLRARVINQERAIETVVPALKRMRVGLSTPGRLLGAFLFLGATGVGKTELARTIAEVAFGTPAGLSDPPLITIDCGNLTEARDIVQLLGAPQGLVGYKEGQLTNGLRDKPRAVILFDEAEKAHPHIWQSLLPLFDKGIVREADGTEYDATGCIIGATSNQGYREAMQAFNLWQATREDQEAIQRQVEEFVWVKVKSYFSPEFLGRFGRENVIFFNHFNLPSYVAIAELQINKLIEEMRRLRNFEVVIGEAAVIEHLANLAWQRREEGARPVARLIDRHLRDHIVEALARDPERTNFSFAFLAGRQEIVLED